MLSATVPDTGYIGSVAAGSTLLSKFLSAPIHRPGAGFSTQTALRRRLNDQDRYANLAEAKKR
jgi:hypothetical protein